jgi:hypothetical protein
MNKLSEFFKSKLEGRTFQGKEEAWADLEAMLDKAMPVKKKRYKRRGIFFWLFPLLGSLLLLAVFRGEWVEQPSSSSASSQSLKSSEATVEKNTKHKGSRTSIVSDAGVIPSSIQQEPQPTKYDPAVRAGISDDVSSSEGDSPALAISKNASLQSPANVKGPFGVFPPYTTETNEVKDEVIHAEPTIQNIPNNEALTALPSKFNITSMLSPYGWHDMHLNETNIRMTPVSMEKTLFRSRNWFYSFSLAAGVMAANQQQISMQQAKSGVLQRRNMEERNTLMPLTGVDFKVHYQHFTLGSGIQITQWGESRNYSDDFFKNVWFDSIHRTYVDNSYWQLDSASYSIVQYSLVPVVTDSVITYYNSAEGVFVTTTIQTTTMNNTQTDTLVFYKVDSTLVQQGDSVVKVYQIEKTIQVASGVTPGLKGRNITTYVELPLMLGYEFLSRRWGFGLEAGVALGRLLRTKTIYLNQDESGLMQVGGDQYRSWLLNYQMRMQISYRLNNGLRLEISPMLRRTARGVFNDNAAFQQRYSGIGGTIGLRYTW